MTFLWFQKLFSFFANSKLFCFIPKIEQTLYNKCREKVFQHSSRLDPLILVSYIFGLIQLHVYSWSLLSPPPSLPYPCTHTYVQLWKTERVTLDKCTLCLTGGDNTSVSVLLTSFFAQSNVIVTLKKVSQFKYFVIWIRNISLNLVKLLF